MATSDSKELERRRAAARRTALWLALLAASVFAAFIASGVLGR